MKRRVLLVDDEVAVLLTLKAVLEINGFDVDTAASAREGRMKLRTHEFDIVITDMRMESEQAGADVILAARTASFSPAIALLTAFPVADEDWQEMGADHMLVKPMHTRILLDQIHHLLQSRDNKLTTTGKVVKASAKKTATKALAAAKPRKAAKKAVAAPKSKKSTKPAVSTRKRNSEKSSK
jgi:DNA-binding response OmpR family regulator